MERVCVSVEDENTNALIGCFDLPLLQLLLKEEAQGIKYVSQLAN